MKFIMLSQKDMVTEKGLTGQREESKDQMK